MGHNARLIITLYLVAGAKEIGALRRTKNKIWHQNIPVAVGFSPAHYPQILTSQTYYHALSELKIFGAFYPGLPHYFVVSSPRAITITFPSESFTSVFYNNYIKLQNLCFVVGLQRTTPTQNKLLEKYSIKNALKNKIFTDQNNLPDR